MVRTPIAVSDSANEKGEKDSQQQAKKKPSPHLGSNPCHPTLNQAQLFIRNNRHAHLADSSFVYFSGAAEQAGIRFNRRPYDLRCPEGQQKVGSGDTFSVETVSGHQPAFCFLPAFSF